MEFVAVVRPSVRGRGAECTERREDELADELKEAKAKYAEWEESVLRRKRTGRR